MEMTTNNCNNCDVDGAPGDCDCIDGSFTITEEIPSNVVINEIYYHPPSDQGSDYDSEFVELYNPNNFDIDISLFSVSRCSIWLGIVKLGCHILNI